MESFQIVWKVSRLSVKFPDCLESFQIVWIKEQMDLDIKFAILYFFVAKTICALFVAKTICAIFARKNDLRTSSGKFLCVEICHPESSDFLGLCLMVTLVKIIIKLDLHYTLYGWPCANSSRYVTYFRMVGFC